MKPVFFASRAKLRAWLAKNHDRATDVAIGFYKTGSGRKGITYSEALDEALCWGWIDGVRKSIDAERWMIRFLPRKKGSVWSQVNVGRANAQIASGAMAPPGRAAFDARDPSKSKHYSTERKAAAFDAESEKQFRRNKAAWKFFAAQAPSYRRAATYWVMSAKKEATRRSRLEQLIEVSAAGEKPKPLTLAKQTNRALAVLAAVALSRSASAAEVAEQPKVPPAALAVEVEVDRLANGLVVLLSPDPTAASVLVDMTFRAGTLHEPPGKSGLAHLVEHLLMRGSTPETDYVTLLEQRRARFQNAYTTSSIMMFRAVVPPEELPAALWVCADRVGTLAGNIEQKSLDRELEVVAAERAERYLDKPFGLVDLAITTRMFPRPHPLHGQVIGAPDELASVKMEDVRAFVARTIVPANAVLTLAGNFDLATARRLVAETVAGLPGGAPVPRPSLPASRAQAGALKMRELLSRRPRVTVLWKLDEISRDTADALDFGALALSSYVDGAFGTEVEAELVELEGQGFFRLDVTMPYDKPMDSAEREAEVFLRYLTAVDLPRDVFNATRLAHDRATMFAIDTLQGRAGLLTALQLLFGDARRASQYNTRYWRFARHDIQHTAWKNLVTGPPRLVIHARPEKPAQPKLEWDERP